MGTVPPPEQYLDALFGASGYLSQAFPGYVPRDGQVQMAAAVDAAIRGERHLLVEAGTGTGKSLAYCGPSTYYAALRGHPVVIATANIALQEQIVQKDLPLLQRVVPWHFTFALLKGRNNYLCVDKVKDDIASARSNSWAKNDPTASLPIEAKRQLPILRQWADDEMRAQEDGLGDGVGHGDVSDLPFVPHPAAWSLFSVAAKDCKKARCKSKHECFASAAIGVAKRSSVVVTNYALLLAHIEVYRETGLDIILPPATTWVLDEAHKLPDIARDFFGVRITESAVTRAGKFEEWQERGWESEREIPPDQNHSPGLEADVRDNAKRLFFALSCLRADARRYPGRLTGEYQEAERAPGAALVASLGELYAVRTARVAVLTMHHERIKRDGRGMTDRAAQIADEIGALEKMQARALGLRTSIDAAMNPRNNAAHVFYLREDEGRKLSLESKLLNPGDILDTALFGKRAVAPGQKGGRDPDETYDYDDTDLGPVTVVCTSATLTTSSQSFTYVAKELGVPRERSELVAPSPFEWSEQMLFVIPAGLPSPVGQGEAGDAFRSAVVDTVKRTILLADGRTLGLFTSYKNLNLAYDGALETCRRQGIRLLKQGDAPRTKLIEEFRNDVRSVLLGTESFWAGVDVPGESLSVVLIDKLPFPTPDDPVLRAIESRDRDWFQNYSIPRALIAFRQGIGRLIRDRRDRGVVVCLDNRILEKNYGKQFLRALPRSADGSIVPKTTRLEDLVEWLHPSPPIVLAMDLASGDDWSS
jgi:ATP-dependent DNA helicase DinG